MKDAPLRHHLEYALYRLCKGAALALPHAGARRLGSLVGAVVHGVSHGRRQTGLDNLRFAFPSLVPATHRRICRRAFRNVFASFFDALSALRFDAVELCRRLRLEGWDHVQAAEEQGRGLFILGAHFGTWEIAAYPIGLYRGPLHVVGRPPDNPHIRREIVELRHRFGNESIWKRGAARQVVRILRERGRVGMLIDQRVFPNEGIRVPFFGRPATTTPLLARLSLRSGAPVVPVFGFLEKGGRYRVVYRAPIEPEGSGEEGVGLLTAKYLAATEEEIRRHPELWMWMHRRWG